MSQNKTILVAEDEPDIRGLIKFSLEFIGLTVVEATNGQQAVDMAPEVQPDLIMLDVRMPKLSGYEACEKLKSQDETKDYPVVFLSARGQDQEIKYGLRLGAVEYILKPFAPDELQQRVSSLLERLEKDTDS
jgi:DNA-binding response OmpR family regulator